MHQVHLQAADVYSDFLGDIKELKDSNALPVKVDYGEYGTLKYLYKTMHHGTIKVIKNVVSPC